jgi:hypothetical protein
VRTLVLVLALGFIAILGFLTMYALLTNGAPDILELFSAVLVVLFAFGVIGALSTPPRDG